MQKIKAVIIGVFCFFFIFGQNVSATEYSKPLQPENSIQSSNYVPGEVIVKYKKNSLNLAKSAGKNKADSIEKNLSATKIGEVNDLNMHFISSSRDIKELIAELQKDPNVEYAEPNFKKQLTTSPNDSYFFDQWALQNTGQSVHDTIGTAGDDISATEAWGLESPSQSNILVADIDGGADLTHPDLLANFWDGSTCKNELNVSIAGGCPNHGWDYEHDPSDPNSPPDTNNPTDTDGHGTLVIGIIGAVANNSLGVSGVSYYNHLKIMPIKFGLDTISEIKAINFAKNNGAKVINASFAGPDFSQPEKDAIDSFPGIFVAAAGNDSLNNDLHGIAAPGIDGHEYPADYTSANIISVAATDQNDNLASFSNYGATSVDIAAPGVNIISAYYLGGYTLNNNGTSFASPYVAGVTAMAMSTFPTMSLADIKNQVLSSGDSISSLAGKTVSGKRLDYKKAIQAIAPFPMYRLYNTKNGAYLYARGDADKAHVLNTWPEFEFTDGVPAFYASLTSQAGLTPIYRLYNTKNGMYLYTRGDADKAHVMSTWPEFEFTDGVPAFYASLTSQAGLTPIYRLYNTLNGMYLYTRSEADKVHVMSTWPEFEFTDGVPAFYAYITADSGPALYKYSGPDIPVGLWYYGKSDIQNSHFQIDANRPYNIKDSNENIIAQIDASSTTSVTYNDNGILEVSGSIASMIINSTINFDAADGDNSTIIFNVHRSNFVTSDWRGIIDQYRGKIKVQYYRGPDIYNGCDPTATSCPDVTQIWVVNTLPLELYTQGTAETSGTGNINHTKVMATSFRTYGYWYIENATKYVPMGFKIRSDGSSQFYGGYDWEIAHANITTSAKATRGMVAWYGGDIALTPYSSWSDGNTRSLTSYPWCQAVSDPYGNWYATHSSAIPAGNHMWGLIANGSVNLATNYGWDWQRIMKYYYTGISFNTLY